MAYHEGKLPGNLHYNDPMEDVPSVRDGRIQVVTSTTSFNRGFTALNCFSYTGANYHCLFKGHHKVKVETFVTLFISLVINIYKSNCI